MPAGVYVIRNRANGRFHLGGSLNVHGAINRDRFELQQGTHRNAALLKDWREFGAEAFEFEVIDTLKPRDDPAFDYKGELDAALQMWREEFQASGKASYDAR